MIAILSPAKRIDESRRFDTSASSLLFPEEAGKLVETLRVFSPEQLQVLMKISRPLAMNTFQRIADWHFPPVKGWVHALAGFNGEVFNGLQATTLSLEELNFAQNHLRVLSGLYGLLRPFDAMLPYRLEMGAPLKTKGASDLYAFWKAKIALRLEEDLADQGDNLVVNLASGEYSKVFTPHLKKSTRVVTPVFMEYKQGKYSVVAVYAKQARGAMSRFIIQNRLSDPEHLKAFDTGGYLYEPSLSDESRFVFGRRKA